MQHVALWYLYSGSVVVSRLNQMWSKCAAGGFVVFVYRHCVVVSRSN